MTILKLQKFKFPVLIIFAVLFFVGLICVGIPIAQAATYYVSTTGSDTNSGTISSPFRTISRGVNALGSGDTLYIRGGTYYEQKTITADHGGTQSAPTTLSGYPGETVVISGNNYTNPSQHSGTGLIQVYANWFIVRDITITQSGDTGINTDVSAAHVTIDNVYSHHNWGSGIVMSGNYNTAQNCRAWSNSMMNKGDDGNFAMSISWGLGITCARYPDYCTIRNCRSWENWGEGISTFESMHATIENNISYDNGTQYYLSDTGYSTLQNNIAYCSPGNDIGAAHYTSGNEVSQQGITVGDETGGYPYPLGPNSPHYRSRDNTVINNLIIGCDRNLAAQSSENNLYAYNTIMNADPEGDFDPAERADVYFYSGTYPNQRFYNNIIVEDNDRPVIHMDQEHIITFSNNLWSRPAPSGHDISGTGTIIGQDPRISRAGTFAAGQLTADWFRLQSTSPAINHAAVISQVNADFFNTARGSSPDIGAIEFIAQSQPTCTDNDSDGYGTSGSTGCTNSGTDCNDSNAAIHPNATEICGNGIDEDCNGSDLQCAPTATLSVSLSGWINGVQNFGGGPAPLLDYSLRATVGGTATGQIEYWFYCNAPLNDSTDPNTIGVPYAAHGFSDTNVIQTSANICQTTYSTVGTYLAKVIVHRAGLGKEERMTVGVVTPSPTLDIKARLDGTENLWTDTTLDIGYNQAAQIRVTYTGMTSCIRSGDWTGIPGPSPELVSTANLTVPKTYIYGVTCTSTTGTVYNDTVFVRVAPPTLNITLTPSQTTGQAPLNNILLTAAINTSTSNAIGTINYTFYCDRSDAGTNITNDYSFKTDNRTETSMQTPASNACSYTTAGTHYSKVIVERDGATAQVVVPITVTPPPAPVITLTADDTTPDYNTATTIHWSVANVTNSDTCIGSGGSTGWPGAKTPPAAGSFTTGNLTNSGQIIYTLSCTNAGGTRTSSLTLTVGSAPVVHPPQVILSSDNIVGSRYIPYGENIPLEWSLADNAYYDLPSECHGTGGAGEGGWLTDDLNPNGGEFTTANLIGLPTGRPYYIYTIVCTNSAGSSASSFTVYVAAQPPQDVNVIVSDHSIAYNGTVNIDWTADANTTEYCTGNWQGFPAGSIEGYMNDVGPLTTTTTFTLTCSGIDGQQVSDSEIVRVNLPNQPTANISANPTTVAHGASSTLSWSSANTNANSCAITGPNFYRAGLDVSGSDLSTGNLTNLPSVDFTITCIGPGGQATDSVTINVNPPPAPRITNFRAEPSTINHGDSTQLTWSTTDAVRCEASGDWFGSKELSGTYDATNLGSDRAYSLTCYNAAGGYTVAVVNVTVAPEVIEPTSGIVFLNPLENDDINAILNSLRNLIWIIAVGLAAIMIIISGIIILTSMDDRERLNKGKNMLKWTLVGLAIALSSSFIIGLLNELLGLNL